MAIRDTDIRIGFDIEDNPVTKLNDKIDKMVDKATGGFSSMEKKINKTTNTTKKMGTSAEKVNGKISKTMSNVSTKANRVTSSFDRIRNAIQKVSAPLQNMRTKMNQAKTSAQQTGSTGVKGMQNLTSAIFKANAGLDLLKAGFRKIIDSIGTMIKTTDTWVSTQARLGLVVDEGSSVEAMQDKILASANRSRADYTATAGSVAKLDMLAGENFANDDEVIKFSELMSKSFAVSGADSASQEAGMYQLTQAMAAGKLQGDEFRSIMENAPMLADAIAKYTGKSKGELKEMSSEGLITADIIKKALFKAGDDIEAKFEKMPMTFEGAWTQIKNDALFSFKGIMEGANKLLNSDFGKGMVKGISKTLKNIAKGIENAFAWIVEHEDLVKGVLLGIATAIAVVLVPSIWSMVASVWAFTIALLANPITWIVIAIVALVAALYMAYQKNETFRKSVDQLFGKLSKIWEMIKLVTGAFFGNSDSMDTLAEKYPELAEKVEWARQKVIAFKDDLVEGFNKIKDTVVQVWEEHIQPVVEKFATRFQEIWEGTLQPFISKFVEGFFNIMSAVGQLWNEFLAPFISWLFTNIVEYVMPILETLGDVFMSVWSAMIDIVGGVWDVLVGIIEFITGVFTGDWELAWEGVKKIFSGIWESLKGIVEGVINVIIDLINFMIRKINGLSFDIPEWVPEVGGETFGFNIPEIEHVNFEKGTRGANSTPDSFIAGENGPELITNAGNSRVYPAGQTEGLLRGNESNYNITINVTGGSDASETARLVKQELEDLFASFGRRNPRYTEI